MKHALLLIGLLAGLTGSAAARPRPLAPPARPAADSVELRAGRCAQYLTDALQLSSRQAQVLRRSLLGQNLAAPAAARQLDGTLLRILTPGQYNAFVWLRETAPR